MDQKSNGSVSQSKGLKEEPVRKNSDELIQISKDYNDSISVQNIETINTMSQDDLGSKLPDIKSHRKNNLSKFTMESQYIYQRKGIKRKRYEAMSLSTDRTSQLNR